MQKIRLALEKLTVESFSTDPLSAEKGTVRAHSSDGYMGLCTGTDSAGPGCNCPQEFGTDRAPC